MKKGLAKLALLIALVLLIPNSFGTTISLVYSNDNYTWKNAVINGGGFVTGLVYNPIQSGLLYARTDVGGCYSFDSSTETWTPLMDFIGKTDNNDMGILSLAIDPTDAGKVYMMTGMYTNQWAGNGFFYRSKDKGATWTKSALPFKVGGNENGRNTGERLQVDPNLPSVLFMGSTTDGLYKSTDYGTTWSKVTSFTAKNINFIILDSSSSFEGTATKRIIVGTKDTSNSMYISNDGGITWNTISGQPSGYCPIRADLANGTLFVTYSAFNNTSDMPGPGGASSGAIYKYNISTGVWTNITPSGEGAYYGFGGISIDRQNAKHLIVASLDRWWPSDEIFQSFDGGVTWTKIFSTGIRNETKAPYAKSCVVGWISDIKIDPYNSNKAIFSFGGGVYISDSLTNSKITWSYENSGLEETCTLELKSPPVGTNLLSAMGDVGSFRFDDLTKSPANGVFKLGDKQTNWSIDFSEAVPNKIVRSYSNDSGKPYGAYSTDGGATWTEFASAPSNVGLGGFIAISADGSKIVWMPRDTSWNYTAPYISTDNGSSWTACSGGITGIKPVADRVNPNKFYQFDYVNGKVYVSSNGGASFSVGATGLPLVPSYLSGDVDMKAVFGNEGHLWAAAGSGGLYFSTNSGTSFKKIPGVTEAYKVGFGKSASSGGYPAIYLNGTIDGVYGIFRSDDQGASWIRINDAAHQYNSIADITGDPKLYGRVYIGAGGRGIVYGDLSGGSPINYGDLNDDGKVNSIDLSILKRILLGIYTGKYNAANADMNGDKAITPLDYSLLKSKLL